MNPRLPIEFFLCGFLAFQTATADTITLNHTNAAVFDTQISGPLDDTTTTTRDEPNFNFDSHYAMSVRAGTATRHLGLVQIQGFLSNLRIPPGSTVTSATLRLFLNDDLTSGYPRTVRLHRMLKAWTTDSENPTTWNNPDNAFGTDGIALDGAEAAAAATAEITLDQGAGRFVTANVTADLQAWVNGDSNFGWVLLTDNPDDSAAFRTTNHGRFNTSETKPATAPAGTPADPILPLNKSFAALTDAEWRQVQSPTLVVTYTPSAASTDTKLSDATFFAALDYAAFPGLAAVNSARQSGNFTLARAELAAYLRGRPQPVVPDPADFAANISGEPPTPGTSRLDASTVAEKALTLKFTADATMYQFPSGLPLDWEFSPNSGTNFPQYMNRFSYGEDMAGAFASTGNPIYLSGQVSPRLYGFAEILRDWITGNPVPAGNLNGGGLQSWTTMQAGLRAGHFWPRAWQRVVRSPAFPGDTLVLWMKSYFEHAEYLRQYTGTGNGLAMEINGLFMASVLFPEFAASASWRQTALDRLADETGPDGQIYPDGAQTELTPLYHFTTLRHFANIIRAAQANGIALPDSATAAAESLFDYAMDIAEPSLSFPDWNDSDPPGSGTLTGWMQLAAALFPGRGDFEYFATNRAGGTAPAESSFLLPWAGQALMRSGWDAQARYLAFEGGPLGTSHHHDDKLGLVLNAFGERLVIDSGRYAYDSSNFNAYSYSPNAHSVVHIGDYRQSRRLSAGVFRAESPYDIEWRSTAAFDYVTASFGERSGEVFRNGSSSSSPTLAGAVHRRHVLFVKPDYWVVVDDITQPDTTPRAIVQQFHLANQTVSTNSTSQRVTLQKPGGPSLTLTPLVEGGLSASVTTGQTSPELLGWQMTGGSGSATAIPVARFTRTAAGRVQLATVLAPAASGTAIPSVSRLSTGDPDLFGVRITWADGKPATDFIVNLDRSQPLTWNGEDYTTGAIVVQNSTPDSFGQMVSVTTANVTEGTDGAIRFTFARSGGDLSRQITVPFSLSGSAVAGTDYTAPASNAVTFAANAQTSQVDIPLLNDSVAEAEKNLTLTVLAGDNYSPDPARTTATAVVADDDFITMSNTSGAPVPPGGASGGSITISRPANASGSANYTLVLPASVYSHLKTGQSGGPSFVWNDISSNGTAIAAWHPDFSPSTTLTWPSAVMDDGHSDIINFSGGFTIPFYGETITRVRVSSNGWISLGSASTAPIANLPFTYHAYANSSLPNTDKPRAALFPFWEDLYLDATGAIYHKQFADRFVVQFNNIRTYANANIRVTLQAVLYQNGNIDYHYLAVPTNSSVTYTVGIQNRTGTSGLTVGHNTASVGSYTAVRILAPNPWLTASGSTSVNIAPGESASFNLVYNSGALGNGTHSATLTLQGDGLPAEGRPIPVSIDVGGTGSGTPTLSITATDSAAGESSGNPGTFTITRAGSTADALTVPLTVSGTANAGFDYAAIPTTITLPAGQSSVAVTVAPLDDNIVEADASETVILTLLAGSSYTLGSPVSATITIADNDTYANTPVANPTVAVASESSVTLTWSDNFETNTKFRVRRSTDGTTWTGFDAGSDGGPNAASYTFTGLTPGTAYFFQIRAEKSTAPTANSPWSANLAATPTAANAWLQENFGLNEAPATGPAAWTADYDGDGVPNLLERALGSTPTSTASRPQPEQGTAADHLTLAFTPATTQGLRFIVEASSDLSDWSDQTDLTGLLVPGQPYTHTDPASLATNPRRFLRLRVSMQP